MRIVAGGRRPATRHQPWRIPGNPAGWCTLSSWGHPQSGSPGTRPDPSEASCGSAARGVAFFGSPIFSPFRLAI